MTDNESWAAEGGRASASRIRQDLDEMASSVREMEAFLQSAEKPVSSAAPAQPQGKRRGRPKGSKTNPDKLARQAAKRERAKASRGGAPKPPPPAPETPPPPPAGLAGEPPAPPAGRPEAADVPYSAFGVPAAPAPAAPAASASPDPDIPHSAFGIPHSSGRPAPAADLPTIRTEDLYALSPEDLVSLAREQDVFFRAAVRTRADVVFDLLVKHARRGGSVEGSGYFEQASAFEPGPGGEAPPRGNFRGGSGGFLRSAANGLRPAPGDISVPQDLRDRFGLRPGDHVVCRTRLVPQGPRQGTLEATELVSVNGGEPARSRLAPAFAALPVEAPSRRVRVRSAAAPSATLDALDVLAPLAFGARGLLLAPRAAFPEAAALLRTAAAAIAANHPAAKVVLLSLGAAPAADRAAGTCLELSTDFDDPADRHARALSAAVDLARREAERGRDVVLLVDSLPAALGPSGAGFEPGGRRGGAAEDAALAAVRRAFATARALRGGGSVTVLALAADPRAAEPGSAAPDAALAALLAPVLDWTAATPDGAALDPARTRSRALAPDDPGLAASLRTLLADGNAKGAAALLAKLPPPPPPPEAAEIPAFEVPV